MALNLLTSAESMSLPGSKEWCEQGGAKWMCNIQRLWFCGHLYLSETGHSRHSDNGKSLEQRASTWSVYFFFLFLSELVFPPKLPILMHWLEVVTLLSSSTFPCGVIQVRVILLLRLFNTHQWVCLSTDRAWQPINITQFTFSIFLNKISP